MAIKPYLALEASAGSGKTFALTVRYLALLFMGANPQKIVALTFTNKAASEMKSRIFETLKHLESKDELEALSQLTQMSKNELLHVKETILHTLLQADINIATLDSFFAMILRNFSLNLGIQPDFSISNKAMDEALVERFIQGCKTKNLYHALIAFSVGEDKRLGDIFALLHTLYQKKSELDLTTLPQHAFPLFQPVLDILMRLQCLFEERGASSSVLATFHATTLSEVLEKKYLEREDFDYWSYKKYADETTTALLRELKQALNRYINEKEAYVLGQLGALYQLYEQSIDGLIKEFGELAFDDVTNLLYTLLRHEIDKDFLYFRLDGTIEHLLIDEFQDTSIVQYQILLPIIEEIRAGQGVKAFKTLFFVGDIKQSIYRFRGGAKELFGYAKESLHLEVDALDTNYRSTSRIVSFVNELFQGKIKGYEPQKVAQKEEAGYIKVCMDERVEEQLLEALGCFLTKGIAPKDIAILVHTNKDAKVFKELINEHFEHLHVRLEATLRLVDTPRIKMLIALLKYCYFHDELYRAQFLTLSAQSWLTPVSYTAKDLELSPLALLSKLIEEHHLFDGSNDMLSFLEVASRYEDIETFLFALEDLSDEAKSEDTDGLRVLTIHKSKGLEFEHVILCDRLTKENNRSDTLLLHYDEVTIKGVYLNMSKREHIDSLYAKAKEHERRLQDEDRLNALYVAITRAKRSLWVCAKEQNSAFTSLGLSVCERGEITHIIKPEIHAPETLKLYTQARYGAQDVTHVEMDEPSHEIAAISFGIALHYLLEMMESFDQEALQRAFVALQNRYAPILDEATLHALYQRGEHLIADTAFMALVDGARVHKEQPLMYQKERKQIDLLLEFEDKMVIVDYKSSQKDASKHHAQVKLYQEALTQMYAIPIEAYICYLLPNGVELVKSL